MIITTIIIIEKTTAVATTTTRITLTTVIVVTKHLIKKQILSFVSLDIHMEVYTWREVHDVEIMIASP